MDSKTTVAKLLKKTVKVEKDRGWHPNAKDLAISLSLEVGELLEHFQWSDSEKVLQKANSDPAKKEEIELEVADIIIYLGQFVERFGLDLTTAVNKKIKLVNVKYPPSKIKALGDEFYMKQKMKYRGK